MYLVYPIYEKCISDIKSVHCICGFTIPLLRESTGSFTGLYYLNTVIYQCYYTMPNFEINKNQGTQNGLKCYKTLVKKFKKNNI